MTDEAPWPLRYGPFWLPKWMRANRSIWPWKSLGDNLVWAFGNKHWRWHWDRKDSLRSRGAMLMIGGGLQVSFHLNLYPGSLHLRIMPFVGFDLSVWWL